MLQPRYSENFSLREFERSYTREYEFPFPKVRRPNESLVLDLIDRLLSVSKGRTHADEHLVADIVEFAESAEVERASEQCLGNEVLELISSAFPKVPNLHLS